MVMSTLEFRDGSGCIALHLGQVQLLGEKYIPVDLAFGVIVSEFLE